MSDDPEILGNHHPSRLYINPSADDKGCFVTLVTDPEEEEEIDGVQVGATVRLALKVFYIRDRKDYKAFRVVRLKKKKGTDEWVTESSVRVSEFELEKIRSFLSILNTLDLSEAKKERISFESIRFEDLAELIRTEDGRRALALLSNSPHLRRDIYALEAKRQALFTFRAMGQAEASEREWQDFFEDNTWIFGHGLKYVFLDKVSKKLEATTTGHTFATSGKVVDALMKTRAEVGQYVLIEIKKSSTELLCEEKYRSGCWRISDEVAGAVAQIQKTTFDFSQRHFNEPFTTPDGEILPETIYSIQPESFLVVGRLSSISSNVNKIACFELFRKNLRSPTIITFDELYYRARHIVDVLSAESAS